MENQVDSELIDCPICSMHFAKDKIEKHVDSCLRLSNDDKPTTRRASFHSPNTKSFFEKKSKRKRQIVSPENSKKEKKQCLIKENISVSEKGFPPLPTIQTDSLHYEPQGCCSKTEHSEVQCQTGENAKSPSPNNPFQETLLKWSQKNKEESTIVNCEHNEELDAVIFPEVVKIKEPPEQKLISSKPVLNGLNIELSVNGRTDGVDVKTISQKPKIQLGKIPLAEQMRPCKFDDYFGQESFNSNKILKELIHSNKIPSLLLWGPPGCGKTSLAHIIAKKCKGGQLYRFVTLSATMAGVNDVKEAVKVAKNEKKLTKRQTVLFIDEVHRFNKLQQDSFLPHVEDGTLILIGATTENPSFHLNNALLSRCKLVVLKQLSTENIKLILENALIRLNGIEQDRNKDQENLQKPKFILRPGVLKSIADYANGDARSGLNTLEMILQAKVPENSDNVPIITVDDINEEMERGYIKYDRNGDEHYDAISALHKSIRGGDENASLYWLARMLEGGESPLYIARRLVRIASEDIGLANSDALNQAVSAYQACHFIGMPECDVILAQATTYLARSAKSIDVYEAYSKAKYLVRSWPGSQPVVPLHLRNAPTRMMKNLGYGAGYKYTPKCQDDPSQEYLPKELKGKIFFDRGSSLQDWFSTVLAYYSVAQCCTEITTRAKNVMIKLNELNGFLKLLAKFSTQKYK